ncbi:hypothetical protein JG688_00003840 [Phytophthora aleatoria]|uniref:Uncharacterized protein n=1 Tax=Phytophthora aleatoria TaxID=2496075 RepID=A0A8J5JEK7_9STRA|nr:hypothetical protein JG688_00003840 [Phytophthora aleatoria]
MLARGKRLNSARKAMHESYPHRADKWGSEETVIWISLPATPAQSCCGSVRLWNSTDIKNFYAPSEYKEKRQQYSVDPEHVGSYDYVSFPVGGEMPKVQIIQDLRSAAQPCVALGVGLQVGWGPGELLVWQSEARNMDVQSI